MKEQILRGLLRLRHGQEEDGVDAAGAIHAATVGSIDPVVRLNEEWNNREDLIKTGAVTPLDGIAGGSASGAPTRGRMTLMDHKVAEGMTVRLPRSRRRHVRSRADVSDQAEAAPVRDSGAPQGDLGKDSFRSPGRNSGAPTSSVSADGDAGQSRTTLGWTCQACTLVCPEDAVECPACRKRRPRKRYSPARAVDRSGDGVTQGASAQGGSRSEVDSNTTNTVECPMCLHDVEVEDWARPDVFLTKHMDESTRRSGRTRSDPHTGDNVRDLSCPHFEMIIVNNVIMSALLLLQVLLSNTDASWFRFPTADASVLFKSVANAIKKKVPSALGWPALC